MPKKPPVPVVPDRFRGQGPVSQKGDTWLEGEVDDTRRAYVRFPDGKLRLVRCGGTADTFFSIPVRGHDGYVTSKETTWAPESEFVFQPHIKSVAKYGDWPA